MAKTSEQISKAYSTSQGRTDANLANDALHLGGIAADEYATKKYVQDYHNTKESAQKDYIDQQDQAMLNQAKEYTNSQIRNQDFSSFAKVTDVQALDAKLSGELTAGLNAQKSYTDQKAQAIVNDVNANFQEVEGAIGTLNGTVNNLFQSVSNGKTQVAGAITDKGVPTSANDSFSTMANNISQIKTGGSGVDPNYVNTSDADATANDITVGKSAYVKGQKIYGTLIAEPATGYPVIGTDTSNATATASDIRSGKTAYAKGQLLVGTMNDSLEEIHAISNEDYDINTLSFASSTPPDNASKMASINICRYSQDGNYCVRYGTTEDNTKCIESFAVNSEGLYYQASKGATTDDVLYKKYRYTFEELKLYMNDETITTNIQAMAIGCPGFGGDIKKAVLAILYGTTTEMHLRLLTYHLSDNGIIGKAYDNESNYIDVTTDITLENKRYYIDIIGDMNDSMTFYGQSYYSGRIYEYYFKLNKLEIYQTVSGTEINYAVLTHSGDEISNSMGGSSYDSYSPMCLKITSDNKYCYFLGINSSGNAIPDGLHWAPVYDIHSSESPKSIWGKGISCIGTVNNKNYVIVPGDASGSAAAINIYELKENGGNPYIDDSSVFSTVNLTNYDAKVIRC